MQVIRSVMKMLNTPIAIVAGVAGFFVAWIALKIFVLVSLLIGFVILVAAVVLFEGKPTEEEAEESVQAAALRMGKENCAKLQALALKINDLGMRRKVQGLAAALDKILREVQRDPSDAPRAQDFFMEYLPSTIMLVEKYVTLSAAGSTHRSIDDSLDQVATMIDRLVKVFDGQLTALLENDKMDISVEMSMLNASIMNSQFEQAKEKVNG